MTLYQIYGMNYIVGLNYYQYVVSYEVDTTCINNF